VQQVALRIELAVQLHHLARVERARLEIAEPEEAVRERRVRGDHTVDAGGASRGVETKLRRFARVGQLAAHEVIRPHREEELRQLAAVAELADEIARASVVRLQIA
jgi:hypothetical protein